MISYEQIAVRAYANDNAHKQNKAIAAGKAIDNALKLSYTVGGSTKGHFMTSNYLAYFSYEALAHRNQLLNIKTRWEHYT